MLIFIVGYMGSGKTTFGRELARLMDFRFYDLDEVIEISTGYSIADYFEKFGEASFRKKERDMLSGFLEQSHTVIATGGGTPCFYENMEIMNRYGVTIYINTDYETIMERLSGKIRQRPLLKNIAPEQLPAFIKDHLASRQKFYLLSKIRITGDDMNLEELIKILHNFTGNKPN